MQYFVMCGDKLHHQTFDETDAINSAKELADEHDCCSHVIDENHNEVYSAESQSHPSCRPHAG